MNKMPIYSKRATRPPRSLPGVTRLLFVGMILVALVASMTSTAVAAKTSSATSYRSLVGTWLVDAAETEGGVPAFQSLMTFHKGGTMTEVSDELGLGLQGPAQGMWQKRPDGYIATFQLWIFSPDTGEPDGRI